MFRSEEIININMYTFVHILLAGIIFRSGLSERLPYHSSMFDDDSNMCFSNETYSEEVHVTVSEVYKESGHHVCYQWPFWCSTSRLLLRTKIVPQEITRTRIVGICCEGYQKIRKNKCEPVCSSNCASQDDCIEPNNCQKCKRGFLSPLCETCMEGYKLVSNDKCEPICSERCASQRDCLSPDECTKCNIGFKPPRCERECPEGYFTQYCNLTCDCPTTGGGHFECNSQLGCKCQPNFEGPNCDVPKALRRIKEQEVVKDAHGPYLLVGIFGCILFLVIVMLYYKNKITQLKQRIDELKESDSSYYARNFSNPAYDNSVLGVNPTNDINIKVPDSTNLCNDSKTVSVCSEDMHIVNNYHSYSTINENGTKEHIYEEICKPAQV